MNIVMMTNTYLPIIGGLERSVEAFSAEYRKRGHRVLIVAPEFEKESTREKDVLRVPAIQHFNGSDFSIKLPVPNALFKAVGDFKPQVIHSHHPFLMGDTALRVAYEHKVPLVFTHHTLYEHNTHYVPGDSKALKRFVMQLSTGYANLADMVFAPSESVEKMMRQRGVKTDIEVVPTGIDVKHFSSGSGKRFRSAHAIPQKAFVVGHVGRLAPEKNLDFLTASVAMFLHGHPNAHFLVGGDGPLKKEMIRIFEGAGVRDRLHLVGLLKGKELVDAYAATDVFVFASQSETQGVVLAEAMAAGAPIVGVDACGVRDIIRDKVNGRLLRDENKYSFVTALRWMAEQSAAKKEEMVHAARRTAAEYAMGHCADKALAAYERVTVRTRRSRRARRSTVWDGARSRIHIEWELLKNFTRSTAAAMDNKVTIEESALK